MEQPHTAAEVEKRKSATTDQKILLQHTLSIRTFWPVAGAARVVRVLRASTTPISNELLVLFQKDDKTRRIRRDRRTTPEADLAKYTCAHYTYATYHCHVYSIMIQTRVSDDVLENLLCLRSFDRYRHRGPIDGVIQNPFQNRS